MKVIDAKDFIWNNDTVAELLLNNVGMVLKLDYHWVKNESKYNTIGIIKKDNLFYCFSDGTIYDKSDTMSEMIGLIRNNSWHIYCYEIILIKNMIDACKYFPYNDDLAHSKYELLNLY